MSTEARIGVVAGLIIVVIAGVYFLYGNNTKEEDILLTVAPKVTEGGKIPSDAGKKPAPNSSLAGKSVATGSQPGATVLKPTAPSSPPSLVKAPTGANGGYTNSTPLIPQPIPGSGVPTPPAPSAISMNTSAPQPVGPPEPTRGNYPPPLIDPVEREVLMASASARPKILVPSTPAPSPAGSVAANPETGVKYWPRPQSGSSLPGQSLADASSGKNGTVPLRAIPSGTLRDATRESSSPTNPLSSIAPAASSSMKSGWPKTHKIASGDTFSSLADRYYGSSDARKIALIQKANPQKDSRSLRIGDTITIPVAENDATLVTPAAVDTNKPTATDNHAANPVNIKTDSTSVTLPATGRLHIVREGESFYTIAREQLGNGTRWEELFKLNKDMVKGDPKRLRAGMEIKLP